MEKSININKYPKTTKYINLYFHAHQPYRLTPLSIFDVGNNKYYFDGPEEQRNDYLIRRVSDRGYSQANALMLELIKTSGLKVSYSLTGTLLDQLEEFAPNCIDQYIEMVDTQKMEIIGETYYHSLAVFHSISEFATQVSKHRHKIHKIFGYTPEVFRNTELSYRNDVGEAVRRLGFKAIYTEGWDPILGWRSPNYLYSAKKVELSSEDESSLREHKHGRMSRDIKLLLKNYKRSDDIAFRFQLKGWEGYPVTAEKFANWVSQENGDLINLCMDYETIGEHHRKESGIFEFYKHLPHELAKKGIGFILPSEALQEFTSQDEVDIDRIISWADAERDLSAWTGNVLQRKSFDSIYALEEKVQSKLKSMDDDIEKDVFLDTWGRLQTSDHFYYMSTKYWGDQDVHKYFSPYNSPYEAFVIYMNTIRDFELRYLS